MFDRIGDVTDSIVHLKPTRPAFYFILKTIRRFAFWLFLDLGDVGDNRLLKSIIDHRNRRHSTIDNRLSAIIATSLVVCKYNHVYALTKNINNLIISVLVFEQKGIQKYSILLSRDGSPVTLLYTGKCATCLKHVFFKTHVKRMFNAW